MKNYVLYHANCMDGFGAAFAFWTWEREQEQSQINIEYLPVSYGNPPPDIEDGSRVFIVDFCYPLEVLEDLSARCSMVVVIDHHKSAAPILEKWEQSSSTDPIMGKKAIFNLNHSGAVLAWNWLFPFTPVPPILLVVEDRDLWKFDLENTREISAALFSYPFEFELWQQILHYATLESLVEEGESIMRFQDRIVDDMTHRVMTLTLRQGSSEVRVPCVNATVCFSEAANRLLGMFPNAPFSAYFFFRSDGKIQVGLRSVGDMDVSEVAKQYGGGGHKNAAGMVLGGLYFDGILEGGGYTP